MFTPARRANLGLVSAGAIFIVCMLILGMSAANRQMDEARRAPAFVLTDTEGSEVSLASLRGKVTILAFGSIRCPGSNAYCDRLVRLAREYQGAGGLAVFMVNVGGRENPSVNEIRVHRRVSGQTFPTLLDSNGSVAKAFGIQKTPCVVVLDQNGLVRYRGDFDDNRDERLVRRSYCADVVKTLVGEPHESVTLTQAFGPVYRPK